MILLEILWDGILPLIVLAGAGIFLDSRFKLDISTYNKMIIWVALPCFVFLGIYEYYPEYSAINIIPIVIALIIIQYLLSGIIAKIFKIKKEKQNIFKLISTYSSIGHVGISLVMLVYSRMPYLVNVNKNYINESRGTMILLLIIMLAAIHIFVPYKLGEETFSIKKSIMHLIKIPSIYAIFLAVIMRSINFHIEETFLWSIIQHYIGAFMILVIVSIGMQINRIKWRKPDKFIILSSLTKLIINPCLAWTLIKLTNVLNPVDAQVIFIYSAVSSSFLIAIFANEQDKYKSYVMQSIVCNTVMGIFTVSIAIYLAPLLFPIG